jgi:hypothetical protein
VKGTFLDDKKHYWLIRLRENESAFPTNPRNKRAAEMEKALTEILGDDA